MEQPRRSPLGLPSETSTGNWGALRSSAPDQAAPSICAGGVDLLAAHLLDCISEMVIVQDLHRRGVWANQAACDTVGKSLPDLTGRICYEIWGDGTRPCPGCAAAKCLTLGQPGTHQVTTVDGQWWESRIYPFSDQHGHTQGLIQVSRNISEQRRMEDKKLEETRRMLETQRLESLGTLAGGIAHDFNNLLMGVLGYADLTLSLLAPGSELFRYLSGIRSSARRLSDLTQQMLAYSGKGLFVISQLSLSSLVAELRPFLETSFSKKTLLRLELKDDLPRIEADARQIRQLLLNLVMNAAEAIGEREGIVSVRTGTRVLDREARAELSLGDSAPEGQIVFVEVADTGCGMDDATQKKIFEPFFSTKFTGRGLGLAAVQGIVRGHGGVIAVKSEPGRGSVFTVLFPAVRGEAPPAAERRPPGRPIQGSETILLVDDEETVHDVARRMLEQAGFRVLLASSGDECLEIVARSPREIDLVIMDLCMPRLNGVEALRELKRYRADLPVILSSGYAEREASTRFGGVEFSGFLQKPYQVCQLLQKVRDLLDQSHTNPRGGG